MESKRSLEKGKSSSFLPDILAGAYRQRSPWHGKRRCVTSTLILKPACGVLAPSWMLMRSTGWPSVAVKPAIVCTVAQSLITAVVRFHSTARPISTSHPPCLPRIIERDIGRQPRLKQSSFFRDKAHNARVEGQGGEWRSHIEVTCLKKRWKLLLGRPQTKSEYRGKQIL